MASTREPPTFADLVVVALSPTLIMGLVGSLVFFLAEVFYAGRYEGRLLYTLFFFVAGAVLVGRVAVVVDRSRAWAYGGVLAVVTYLAMQIWVQYPPNGPMAGLKELINLVLIGVVWWSSNRLVRDCTFIDDNRTGSGKGLLAAAGWDERRPAIRPDVVEDAEEDDRQYAPGIQGWYERHARWSSAKDKKPHTPGLTVVYFSIAALPIFGLGQALIPADETSRRNLTFWLTASYVGSALGLLLTTSFLGLRRYLRQRKLSMPASMTATWMGLGLVLIVGFLAVGALLPRPYSETPMWNPARSVGDERQASNNAVNRDGAGKGEGKPGDQAVKGDGKATGKGGEPGAKGKSGDAKSGSGEKKGDNGSGGKDKSGGAESKDGDKKGDAQKKDDQDRKDGGREANAEKQEGKKDGSNASERIQSSSVGQTLSKIAGVLKWVVFAAVAIIVCFVFFRHGLQFLANFMPWAKNLLAAIDAWFKGLFGRRQPRERETAAVTHQAAVIACVPFTAFSNPFGDGSADGRSPEDLVRYSFEALESWAGDRDRERRLDETPIEFAGRLTDEFDWLEDDVRRVAVLVARMAYSPGQLPANARETLEEFWDRLTTGAGAPKFVE